MSYIHIELNREFVFDSEQSYLNARIEYLNKNLNVSFFDFLMGCEFDNKSIIIESINDSNSFPIPLNSFNLREIRIDSTSSNNMSWYPVYPNDYINTSGSDTSTYYYCLNEINVKCKLNENDDSVNKNKEDNSLKNRFECIDLE